MSRTATLWMYSHRVLASTRRALETSCPWNPVSRIIASSVANLYRYSVPCSDGDGGRAKRCSGSKGNVVIVGTAFDDRYVHVVSITTTTRAQTSRLRGFIQCDFFQRSRVVSSSRPRFIHRLLGCWRERATIADPFYRAF